jgi:protein-disulfide isomerase
VVASAGASNCDGARFNLSDDQVVGTLEGKPITYKDLGTNIKAAERKAWRMYCNAVADARAAALRDKAEERIIKAAAAAKNMSEGEWMEAELKTRMVAPTDEEARALYDSVAQQQPPGAVPPFEMVKDQVVMSLMRKKQAESAGLIIKDLMAKSNLVDKLPNVRAPEVAISNGPTNYNKGKAGAKVRVVEFADFQCPYCSEAAKTVRELHSKFGDRVEFSYRHYPLRSIHPQAQRAGEYAQCVGAQGKFWAMHDALYAAQDSLDENGLGEAAQKAGADMAALNTCLSSGRGKAEVDADYALGDDLGVEGTPSFFINGKAQEQPSLEAMTAAIEAALRDAG